MHLILLASSLQNISNDYLNYDINKINQRSFLTIHAPTPIRILHFLCIECCRTKLQRCLRIFVHCHCWKTWDMSLWLFLGSKSCPIFWVYGRPWVRKCWLSFVSGWCTWGLCLCSGVSCTAYRLATICFLGIELWVSIGCWNSTDWQTVLL